jgi:putative ABC transport system permease protein
MIASLLRRLRYLLSRDSATRELEEEMRLHRQLRAESLASNGLREGEASAEAARRFGNGTRKTEESRDAWGFGSADAFGQDVRYALRRLRQRPGFTASVVGILALGIGATTAMFSAIDAAFLRPLPFPDPAEIVTLRTLRVPASRAGFVPAGPASAPVKTFDILNVMQMRETFAHVGAVASGGINLADAERPRRLKAGVVSTGVFPVLGTMPVRGRTFREEDVVPGAPNTVVISWGLWQREFGAREMIGTEIPLNNKRYEVIGVMPAGFSFPEESDLWLPMAVPTISATYEHFRGYLPSYVIARRAAGVSAEVAEARLQLAWKSAVAQLPRVAGQKLSLETSYEDVVAKGATVPLRAYLVGDRKRALQVLFGTTALLLLIACANVTNLLLSYGASRARELAVRSVLGATRGRVVRQLLAESVLLAVGGAAVGVALAPVVLGLLRTLMPAALNGTAPAQLDLRVLGFAALLAIVTGIAFGLWPAFGATRKSASETIKSGGGHGASAAGARRSQRLLVGAELAVAAVLLVGAGLMLRSFERLTGMERGFAAGNVATLEMSFARGTALPVRLARVDAMLEHLRAQPGVDAAGVINDLPLRADGGIAISIKVEGAPPEAENRYARYLIASDGYFDAMGMTLKSGRWFNAGDGADTTFSPALISETLARTYWPGRDPLGRTFLFGGEPPAITVVGVVADVREATLDRDPGPQLYFPARGSLGMNLALVARGTASREAMLGYVVQAVRKADPAQAVYNVRTMDQVIGASVASRRANTVLITLFGVLALVIAALGVYAVTSNAVAQRTREFGIRSALGATTSDLLRHVGGEMAVVLAGGVVVGAAAAWAASRVMSGLVYGVGVHDAGTFVMAPVVLILAALAAAIGPARRAMRVQPTEVMRAD